MRRAGLLWLGLVSSGLFGCPRASFDLGVAAFDAGPDGAILWTHVDPLADALEVTVDLEVATDAAFADVVATASQTASGAADHTVRVLVEGLAPDAEYHYRFHARPTAQTDGFSSPAGRFRTAPAPDADAPLRFVVSGDSNVRVVAQGQRSFYVMSDAAAQEPDFFVYFGDTIYGDSGILGGRRAALTLDEYREVHRLTRLDVHLQELMARTASFTGWDDHEVRNDYDGETIDPVRFASGAQAFFEYLPVRQQPGDPPFRTHRRARWGRHVELFFVDGRQFRTRERFCNQTSPDGPPAPDQIFSPFPEDEVLAQATLPPNLYALVEPVLTPSDPGCVADELGAPGRTYLGAEQLQWLKDALLDSDATWKILVNNTPLSTLLFFPYDRWEGYAEERDDLLAFLRDNLDDDHLFVITTDFHTNLALRRPEFAELIVGPIGMNTFGRTVLDVIGGGAPLPIAPSDVFFFLNVFLTAMNGGFLGAEHDAYAYAVVEVAPDAQGVSRLRVSVRGDRDYATAPNDPSTVEELFSFELPTP
jgi:phosphodiesterase/alkaline phosphatase D-like protein